MSGYGGNPVKMELIGRLGVHSEEMALAMFLWLCTLPLVVWVIIPLLGVQVGIAGAVALLVAALALCWGLCGWKVLKH